MAEDRKVLGEERPLSESDVSDILPRPVGLRGRLSSWRRKRRSITAVALPVVDEEDEASEDDVGSAASSLSKKVVSVEAPRVGTAPVAGRTESSAAERSGSESANVRGAAVVVVAPTAPTPAAEVIRPGGEETNGEEEEEKVPPAATGPAADGDAEASSKEPVSRAPPRAPDASISAAAAPEHPAPAADVAPVAGAPRPVVLVDLEGEKNETSIGIKRELVPVVGDAEERPLDTLEPGPDAAAPADNTEPRAGRTEVAKGQESRRETVAAAAAERLRTVVVQREDGDTGIGSGGSGESGSANKGQEGLPSPSVLAKGDEGKDSLASGLEAGKREKIELPPFTRSGRGETAAAAITSAKEPVEVSAAPAAAGEDLGVAASASSFKNTEGDSAAPSSPSPTGSTLSPRAAAPTEATTQKETASKPSKPQEREEAIAVAGQTVSDMKPHVLPSSVADDSTVSVAAGVGEGGAAVAAAQGKAVEVSGGNDTAKKTVNPAAEFLKDWMDKAVPQKKAELKQRESAVCWERQWCVSLCVCVCVCVCACVSVCVFFALEMSCLRRVDGVGCAFVVVLF